MSESNRYYAVDARRVTDALRGRSERFNSAIKTEFHPVTESVLARMKDGDFIPWDMTPLRHQPWKVFTEVSMLIAMASSIQGKEVGWNAWSGRGRLLIPLLDWHPLSRGFSRRFASRPVAPFYFSRRHLVPTEKQTPYVESYPHSFFLNQEFAATIPPLLRLIEQNFCAVMEESTSPVTGLRPGRPIDKAKQRSLLLPDTDDNHQVWQFNRAIHLYNALCHAAKDNTDLFCIGY